jgi:hypothetical protein
MIQVQGCCCCYHSCFHMRSHRPSQPCRPRWLRSAHPSRRRGMACGRVGAAAGRVARRGQRRPVPRPGAARVGRGACLRRRRRVRRPALLRAGRGSAPALTAPWTARDGRGKMLPAKVVLCRCEIRLDHLPTMAIYCSGFRVDRSIAIPRCPPFLSSNDATVTTIVTSPDWERDQSWCVAPAADGRSTGSACTQSPNNRGAAGRRIAKIAELSGRGLFQAARLQNFREIEPLVPRSASRIPKPAQICCRGGLCKCPIGRSYSLYPAPDEMINVPHVYSPSPIPSINGGRRQRRKTTKNQLPRQSFTPRRGKGEIP